MMQGSIKHRRRLALERGSSAYSARRTAVLAAAAEVFRHHGFNGTTMGSIATATGISRASLYYYLSGKQDLYREVVTGAVEANAREAERILATIVPPAMKLTEAIVALMRSFDTHYPFLQVYVQEAVPQASTRGDGWAAEMVGIGRRYEEFLTAIVQEGMDQGVFHSELPARVVTYGIVGMLNWTCRWYRPGMDYSNREIGMGFAEMVVNGLSGIGGARLTSDLSVSDQRIAWSRRFPMEFAEQLAPVLAGLAADGVHVQFLPRVADELRVRVQETSDCEMCVLDTSGLEHFLATAVSEATGENLNVRVIERSRIAGHKDAVSTAEDW